MILIESNMPPSYYIHILILLLMKDATLYSLNVHMLLVLYHLLSLLLLKSLSKTYSIHVGFRSLTFYLKKKIYYKNLYIYKIYLFINKYIYLIINVFMDIYFSIYNFIII